MAGADPTSLWCVKQAVRKLFCKILRQKITFLPFGHGTKKFLHTTRNACFGQNISPFICNDRVFETQRQWSDLAIVRTTPALLGLFSLVTLRTHDLAAETPLMPKTAAWYPKRHCTFSDAIAAVRREIWCHQVSLMSRCHRDIIEFPDSYVA